MATDVVAIDFGASSMRVCRVGLGEGPASLDIVHRYHHEPVLGVDGVLRWDWPRLLAEMELGLNAACEAGDIASIGIDTWGVDYGLVDEHGALIAPPVSYRDNRTDGFGHILERVGAGRFFAVTGLQVQPFNTIFQVAAHDSNEMQRARHLLMLPELLVHHLTGVVSAERTSAGTTGLVDIGTGEWSRELLACVELDRELLAPIQPAGSPVGTWRGIPVHLVGGHDTASAVVGMGAVSGTGTAFASAGTWLLVGREQPSADLSHQARTANFSNEMGALGGVRLLKNLGGTWLLEGCRDEWADLGLDELLSAAAREASGPVIDVCDPRFLHPRDMLAEVVSAAGLPVGSDPAVVVRCVIDSMAAGTAAVIEELGGVTSLQVFGGASTWQILREALARATGLPVVQGPIEATALGNALVQGVALRLYDDLDDARAALDAGGPDEHTSAASRRSR